MTELQPAPIASRTEPLTIPLLSAEQCDEVIEEGRRSNLIVDSTARRIAQEGKAAGVTWKSTLQYITVPAWLLPEVQRALDEAAKHFGYTQQAELHVCSLRCQPRVATYEVGQGFTLHQDVPHPDASFPTQKIHWLAVSLQLDDSDAYDDGDLLIQDFGQPIVSQEFLDDHAAMAVKASRVRGHATVFPAYWGHEVTRVTRGTRRALIFWGNLRMSPDVSLEDARNYCDRNHLFGEQLDAVEAIARRGKTGCRVRVNLVPTAIIRASGQGFE